MALETPQAAAAAAAPRLERPISGEQAPRLEWGSDVAAQMMRALDLEYVALNPGASYRGIHDSLVNFGGNQRPGMILCNHEEIAVAVAHGYAKYRGRAMGAFVHSNVGLLHASMAIFNAYLDRAPVVVFGATGPMDSTRRRPWIEWIHTSYAQSEPVRGFTKWDHQPGSVAAFPESMLRAWQTAMEEPRGPVYLVFDVGLQEQKLDPSQPIQLPDVRRYALPTAPWPDPAAVKEAAELLSAAAFPVILLGREMPTDQSWRDLVALAEALGAAVVPDAKAPATFPTSHPLVQTGTPLHGAPELTELLKQADVVLSLNRIDLLGTFRQAGIAPHELGEGTPGRPHIINVSLDHYALRAWTMDSQELAPTTIAIGSTTALTAGPLLEQVQRAKQDHPERARAVEARTQAFRERRARLEAEWEELRQKRWDQAPISVTRVVAELKQAMGPRYADSVVARLPLTWPDGIWNFDKPQSFLGSDGGGGVGSGPGMSVGSALGAMGSGRTVVTLLGDGDTLMTPSALWTAAHYQIPLLIVLANNQSYFNDEEHQQRMAVVRSRPVENRWIGQRMSDPAVDFANLARSYGVEGYGPVTDPADLGPTYARALAAVDEGRPALVDVRISPR